MEHFQFRIFDVIDFAIVWFLLYRLLLVVKGTRASQMFLGLALFTAVMLMPAMEPALDPDGKEFPLTSNGKAALALFLLAATWLVFEVIPIGVTSITIGIVQALFLIREPRVAFTDFMVPSVWFIFGSLVIGMVFTKTGLTRRLAYRMLVLVGEKPSQKHMQKWG